MDRQMLEGKVAIITGASYGMGKTMAELFAEEGASVVLTARHQEQLDEVVEGIRAKGGKAIGVVADVCSLDETKRVFEETLKEFGDLDILINNAGIGEQKMIDETDDDWMLYVMNTNLGGPMRYIREALKVFMPKNDGVIINISSVNGTRPFCGATYTSTKGALNTLTKNVAMRLIDTNIRCNAVAPGATKTPAHLANKKGEQPGGAKMLEYSGHYVYFPGPECECLDQAYACLFLASKMGRAVRGQVLQVCNGNKTRKFVIKVQKPELNYSSHGSDCFVLFYKDFKTSYSYTELGFVENPIGLANALGNGNVKVSIIRI